jgi:signal recognition particle receptor subunit beta
VPLPEASDETGLASRIVPRAAKLGIPLVGGAALLAGLTVFVAHKLFRSGKSVEGGETDPFSLKGEASSSYSLTLDLAGNPHKSLTEWYDFIKKYLADAGKQILIWGPCCSGKTSLLQRISTGTFVENVDSTECYTRHSIGVSSNTSHILDASGSTQYNIILLPLVRIADLVIYVLNSTDQYEKDYLNYSFDVLQANMKKNKPIMVVLNKKDLNVQANTSDEIREVIEAKIKDHEWFLYEASAKTGESGLLAWSGRRPASAAPAAPAAPAQG